MKLNLFLIRFMITFVTGGQRSGKSLFAEKLALARSSHPVYLATARALDDEFRRRVEIHKQRRGPEWTTIEAPLHVGDVVFREGAVVLLDCLTLLATNWMFECGENVDDALRNIKEQLSSLFAKKGDFIVVTNEIGLGGISENALQRKFADLQGAVNSFVASAADEAYMTISGIPVKIK